MEKTRLHFMPPEALLARTPPVRASHDEVHVWSFLLEGTEAARARCASVLSAVEIERARRFHFERHRVAYVFAHGLMRHLLGAYCECDPAALEFVASEYGKPALGARDGTAPPVSFNLSHSHGRALLAVSQNREIGVDIEQENPRTEALNIASSYFHGPEFEAIRDAPLEMRVATFFRYWAAKEAVLKAEGVGLHAALDSFRLRFAPDLATAQVDSLDETRIAKGWFVRRLVCDQGWHAAVAARSEGWQAKVMLHEA
jgi:4'-phosphopantetheinyl transferase